MTSDDQSTSAKKLAESPISKEPLGPKAPEGDQPQMDPGQLDYRVYTFTDASGAVVATVLIPRTAFNSSFNVGTEYWFRVTTAAPAQRITVTWQDYPRTAAPPAATTGAFSFRMNQAAAWTSAQNAMPAINANTFVNNDAKIVIGWNLRFDASANQWTGQLAWFNATGQNTAFAGTMPPGGVVLTAATSCETKGITWFHATVTPF